jgi:hypothetical protein
MALSCSCYHPKSRRTGWPTLVMLQETGRDVKQHCCGDKQAYEKKVDQLKEKYENDIPTY